MHVVSEERELPILNACVGRRLGLWLKDDSPLVSSDEEKQMKHFDYRGLKGSISYLAQTTRPDQAFSAHLLSRFLYKPGQAHW